MTKLSDDQLIALETVKNEKLAYDAKVAERTQALKAYIDGERGHFVARFEALEQLGIPVRKIHQVAFGFNQVNSLWNFLYGQTRRKSVETPVMVQPSPLVLVNKPGVQYTILPVKDNKTLFTLVGPDMSLNFGWNPMLGIVTPPVGGSGRPANWESELVPVIRNLRPDFFVSTLSAVDEDADDDEVDD